MFVARVTHRHVQPAVIFGVYMYLMYTAAELIREHFQG